MPLPKWALFTRYTVSHIFLRLAPVYLVRGSRRWCFYLPGNRNAIHTTSQLVVSLYRPASTLGHQHYYCLRYFWFPHARRSLGVYLKLLAGLWKIVNLELLGPTQLPDPTESVSNERKYQQIFGSWGVQVMAAFCLMYVGAETTMGGKSSMYARCLTPHTDALQDGLLRWLLWA
jgi:hypothetical protein